MTIPVKLCTKELILAHAVAHLCPCDVTGAAHLFTFSPRGSLHSASAKDQDLSKNRQTLSSEPVQPHCTPPWPSLSPPAPHPHPLRPPPPTQPSSDRRPTTWSLMKAVLLQESNELEGHQAAGLPRPRRSSARPALGSGPPSSARPGAVQSFHSSHSLGP